MYKIALIGYGKMGKTIDQMALKKGHDVALRIDISTTDDLSDLHEGIDVAIEFTRPESAADNILTCLKNGIPVVSGTTGWLDRLNEIQGVCKDENGAFFYASNYSVGVNIFFRLSEYLAQTMDGFSDYDVDMTEIHHTQKLDAPSGTAITLAEGIMGQFSRKSSWICDTEPTNKSELLITSRRIADTPGTHSVNYHSEIDSIEIKHTAHSRKGFASGALTAAEWLVGKQGCFGMKDLLGF